jgi:hypothetical protein
MTGETLSPADLEALMVRALVASRTAPENARSVASALTQAEIDGQKGHGLSRVPSYAAQANAGKVDGFATSAGTSSASPRRALSRWRSPIRRKPSPRGAVAGSSTAPIPSPLPAHARGMHRLSSIWR